VPKNGGGHELQTRASSLLKNLSFGEQHIVILFTFTIAIFLDKRKAKKDEKWWKNNGRSVRQNRKFC